MTAPLSMAVDIMVWNITKDKIVERMAVSPDRASGVPGPTRQRPPEKDRPSPMSDCITCGEWGPAFNAQKDMLDAHSEKYDLEQVDWRLREPGYKPGE